MNQHEENRQPEEIERDIQRTREEVSSTIDAIQSKLSPGQMMDQAINYARTSLPADFGSNLNQQVRDNPLPVSLIGIGLAWLMMSDPNKPKRRTSTVYDPVGASRRTPLGSGDPYDSYESYDSTYVGAASSYPTSNDQEEGTVHRAMSRVSETGEGMKHKLSETSQGVKNRLSETGHRLSETGQGMKNKASDLGHRSQEQYYRAKTGFSHMLEEQPLIVGAIGLALGAAFGAALPRTQRENELMGHTRDDLMESAAQRVNEQADKLAEKTQQTLDKVGSKVGEANELNNEDSEQRDTLAASGNNRLPESGRTRDEDSLGRTSLH